MAGKNQIGIRHPVSVESHSERSRGRSISSIVTAEPVYRPSPDIECRFDSVAKAVDRPATEGNWRRTFRETVGGDRKKSNELGFNVRSSPLPVPHLGLLSLNFDAHLVVS